MSETYPLLPLRQGILFPGTSLAIGLGRTQSRALLQSLERGQRVVVGFQRDPRVEDPALSDLLPIGVFAEVKKAIPSADGATQVVYLRYASADAIIEESRALKAQPMPA